MTNHAGKAEDPGIRNHLRKIRSGNYWQVADAFAALPEVGITDENGNSPLHLALLNPFISRSSRELESVVITMLEAGEDPKAVNAEGQTPREMARQIRHIENLSDKQYGALGLAIWRLGEAEAKQKKALSQEVGSKSDESWVSRVNEAKQTGDRQR